MADDLDPAAVERAARAYTAAGTADFDGMSAHAQERLLTRMRAALAAAGPLATPEHDAQVAARALREAVAQVDWEFESFLADDGYMSIRPHGKSPGALLADRADRIERQEGGR